LELTSNLTQPETARIGLDSIEERYIQATIKSTNVIREQVVLEVLLEIAPLAWDNIVMENPALSIPRCAKAVTEANR
jgi:hypothetical protein